MNAAATREDWLPLLQRLLACLRRSRETPLQFEIDSAGIVAAALADHPSAHRSGMMNVIDALDERVSAFLGDKDLPVVSRMQASSSLVGWVDDFYRAMRSVHASAIDIIALRVEGFEPRDIAERLSLGLRQVHSILREMRAIWTGQTDLQ